MIHGMTPVIIRLVKATEHLNYIHAYKQVEIQL